MPSVKTKPKDRLILALLFCLDTLAQTYMAKLDARHWHAVFTRRARRLGIKVPASVWKAWEH